MAYVAVKGGAYAIEESIRRLKYERLRKGRVLGIPEVEAGLRSLIDQVMSESSLYCEPLAAMAIKQAEGSPEEAVFILRAYRSTLPRKYYSHTVKPEDMEAERRISASFKDLPGGQILGSSQDYTHRMLDFALLDESQAEVDAWLQEFNQTKASFTGTAKLHALPKVMQYLRDQGLLPVCPVNDTPPDDITKKSVQFPASRSQRLQTLTRGQTGAMTALAYAALRGYGAQHPTVGELRVGHLPIFVADPLQEAAGEGDAYYLGEIKVTEVETLFPQGTEKNAGKKELAFVPGYGICFGQNETKAIAMSILDQCLETGNPQYPTHNEEFVLMHIDSVEATGFVSHLKLPHYVTFQSKLDSIRKTKEQITAVTGELKP
ncbi:MAG: carbon-phosphorus lyase complex subunit PhnI [Syntrophomonadaceae bacterium]|nr:carbon-phosphorus lyase complex subunit PhnI [Syntrophomonadaceae bacterium]